jgi:hypothetical protein
MLELLRDGLWQSIGVVVAIIAIVVSIIIYRRQTQRKALTFVVKSAYPLLTGTEELKGRLQVQVDGVAVNNIDLMFIEFSNSGNVPIERSDFDSPVEVRFEPPARIISVVVDSEEPKEIGALLSIQEENSVTLNPLLLNPGDKVTLKFILSSDTKGFEVFGRVIGIKVIREADPSSLYSWLGLAGLLLLAIGFAIVFHYSAKRSELPPHPPEWWFGLILITIGYAFAANAFLRSKFKFIRKMSQNLSRKFKRTPS